MTHYMQLLGHASPWLLAAAGAGALIPTAAIAVALRRVLRGKKGADVLTVIAAGMASAVAATGMWHFFTRTMHLPVFIQAGLFAFMEVAVLTSALRARANVARDGQAGADGLAVWVLTCVSGFMSATEANSPQEALVRLGAPLVAAWLWERSMTPERRARRVAEGRDADSVFAKIRRTMRERFLARLGFTAPDQSALEIRQDRALHEAVRLTNRLETFDVRFMAARRRRKLSRRRDAAFLESGAAGNPMRKQMILGRVADIRTGDLENLELPSTWAAQVDELTRANTPADAAVKDPQDRPVTVREMPAILAAALMLAAQTQSWRTAPTPSGAPEQTESAPSGTESDDPIRTESDPANQTESNETDRIESASHEETESDPEDPTESEAPAQTQSNPAPRTKSPRTTSGANGTGAGRRNGPPPRTEAEMQELVQRAREALNGKPPTTEAIRVALHIGKNVAADVKRRLLASPNPVRTGSRGAQPNQVRTGSGDEDRIESGTTPETESDRSTQTRSAALTRTESEASDSGSARTEFLAMAHTSRTQSTAVLSPFTRPTNGHLFTATGA